MGRYKTGQYIPQIIAKGTSELAKYGREFVVWLKAKRYAAKTIQVHERCVNLFLDYCQQRDVSQVNKLSQALLGSYESYLLRAKDVHKQAMSAGLRARYLASLIKFLRWLLLQNLLLIDLASKIVLPKCARSLPRHIYSHVQIEEVLSLPDVQTLLGLRDRAMLEVLYSTGIRRTEISRVCQSDVDMQNGLLYIRFGKGGKSRVVPLGERAAIWLAKYVQLRASKAAGAIFLSFRDTPLTADSIGRIVSGYVKKSGKTGACHIFRHAMATQMLVNGASVRHIQEMLGHEKIATTQIYTHINITQLQQVYKATHPSTQPAPADTQAATHIMRGKPKRTGQKIKPNSPATQLHKCLAQYKLWLQKANYSPRTIAERGEHLKHYLAWCQERGIVQVCEQNSNLLERYNIHLANQTYQGRPLAASYIARNLMAIKYFCQYLTSENLLLYDISAKIQIPKIPKPFVGQVLSEQEVRAIFEQVDVNTALGLRDRAILETLYATGIRREELVQLCVEDVNFDTGTVLIAKGKGNTQRVVPISPNALSWISKYLELVRPIFGQNCQHTHLFIGQFGLPLCSKAFGFRIKTYMRLAQVQKPGTYHIFRHTLASAMLDNGADIRYIQQMLGHVSLQSTQIYTQVAIRKLKHVHNRTHPAKPHPHPPKYDSQDV